MSSFFRRRVEATIERMIDELDRMDGDSDNEPEPTEDQNDDEPGDWLPTAPLPFVIAQVSRQRK